MVRLNARLIRASCRQNSMKLVQEFREFAVKGSVIDLAVGVIIGGAFGKIITSLVNDLIMPPISLLSGAVNLRDRFINLSGGKYETLEQARQAGAVTLNVGAFFNTVLDFLIVAICIFFAVRWINKLKRKPQPQEPNTKDCPYCLSSIPKKATKCAHCTSTLKD